MKRKNSVLRETRKRLGWTQKKTAQALGIALRTYQHYEYCERGLTLDMATKIADVLGISVDELSGRNSTTNSSSESA